MKRLGKQFSLVLIVTLLIGMIPVTALSGNVSGMDGAVIEPERDISVMSFNVLDYIAQPSGYALPYQRAPYVVETVKRYMPDIVGFQEAGDPISANNYFNWNNYLATELQKLGYSTRKIMDESVHPSTMTISAGLMICYKTDRFTFNANAANSHGSARYNASYTTLDGKNYKNETSRYYHYIKLYDKVYKTDLYMFNTHLSINVANFGEESQRAGKSLRTQEIIQLRDKMKELSKDLPCFATGDYNCSYNASGSDMSAYDAQLNKMSEGTPFTSSAKVALHNSPVSYGAMIDHCVINTNYTEVVNRTVIYDDTNSWQPSDHRAVMSYMNYRGRVAFRHGNYNSAAATFTDRTSEPSYTFDITPATSAITYKIAGVTGNTVSLKPGENRFTIEVYNGGKLYHSIAATVTYTAEQTHPEMTAEGASVYFAGGAYYAAVEGDSVILHMDNAEFFHNAAGTVGSNGTYKSIPVGRSEKSVRVNGTLYPLYLCRQTLPAEDGAYYLDDDLKDVPNGTLAVYEDKNGVRFVTVGQNGFGSLPAVIAAAPNNAVIWAAPGVYPDNASFTNKNLTIYGNHRGVTPLDISENSWSLKDRGEESLFTGILTAGLNATKDMTLTIDGCSYAGITAQGPIFVRSSNAALRFTLNVANCIFNCSTTATVNGSFINLNTPTRKYGVIRNNYFCPSRLDDGHFIRLITMRNACGVRFEGNYCRMITSMFASSEIASGKTDAGNNNFEMSYNRFEECSDLNIHMLNVYNNGEAHVKLYYNDFVRCGYRTSSNLYFALNESAGHPNNYANCSITVYGNRFVNCRSAVILARLSNLQSDMRDMPIAIQQNRFVETNGFNCSGTVRLNLYATADKSVNLACPNWKINYNYMFSSSVSQTDPTNPAYYVNTKVTKDSQTVTPTLPVTTPYYTDVNLTVLSTGDIPYQTVLLNDASFTYDGSAKTLPLPDLPEGCVLSFSTDGEHYSTASPSFTDPGRYIIYYQIDRIGYRPMNGSALLTIEAPSITDVTLVGFNGKYDGKPHTAILTGIREQDAVTVTADGVACEQLPLYTVPGQHTVTVTVNRVGHKTLTLSTNIIIETGILQGISLQNYEGVYDGKAHSVSLIGVNPDDTLTYSVNGGEFTSAVPKLTEVGYYTLSVRVHREYYEDLILSGTVAIADAPKNCPLTLDMTLNNTLTAQLAPSASARPDDDIKILAQGILGFSDEADAQAYRQMILYHVKTDAAPSTQTVLRDDMGLPAPLSVFTAPKSGVSLAFVTYEYNGIVYTLLSDPVM